jgi:C4-dicarboxylate-specific signal transduction histidine kinase
MIPVTAINQLGEYVVFFTGRTLADSLKAAQDWAAGNGTKLEKYYVQKMDGRSIICGL